MHPQPTLTILILAAACILGCSQPKMSALVPIDDAPTVAEGSQQSIEQKYSCRLPDNYRMFLLEDNGKFPSPDCVYFEENGQKTASDVLYFFEIGDERPWASLEWHHDTYFDRLPKNTLPVARDSCGNLWLLSVGSLVKDLRIRNCLLGRITRTCHIAHHQALLPA